MHITLHKNIVLKESNVYSRTSRRLNLYYIISNKNINHNDMEENDANDNNTILGVSLLSN